MIKIIAGVYGYKENGIISPKDKDSEPFSLDPEREAELVAQGVAEYANVIIPEADQDPADPEDDSQNGADQTSDSLTDEDPTDQDPADTPDEDPTDQDPEDPEATQEEKLEKPEYSDKMKLTELQALAETYNLDAQDMRTKAEVIKLLDDYFAEEDDTEAPPAFGAIDPVE